MREIKFRAWDKESETMVHPKGILFDGRIVNFNCGMLEPYEGYKLMQWTGLLDINGKEIYDDDIVKYKDCGKEHVSEIIQDFSLGTGRYVRCPGLGFYTINESTIVMLEIEIIGNIYENPDLLECEE